MNKCNNCGTTKNLEKIDWLGRRQQCKRCATKASYDVASELPTAPEAWMKLAKENHLRLAAKYR